MELLNTFSCLQTGNVVWIARILNGNEEKIKSFIKGKSIAVTNITKVSHQDAQFSSYKVSINKDKLPLLLDGAFWPRGVVCEVWRDQRRRSRSVDAQRRNDDSNDNVGDSSV